MTGFPCLPHKLGSLRMLSLDGYLLLSVKRHLNMTKIRTSEIDPLKILLIFVDLMLNTVL